MDEESFLARWSRRKSAARSGTDREATPPAPEAAPPPAEAPVPPERDKAAEDEIAALPPIDSLTAESDFKPFLRPGVPGELQSAALRKLWRSDPSWAAPEVLDLHNLDYTLPSIPEVVRTAYQVGKGIIETVERAAETAADEAAPVAAAAAKPDAAPADDADSGAQDPPKPAAG